MNSPRTSDGAIGHYMDTAAFWAGTRERRLLAQFCTQTGQWQAYPRPGSVYTGRRGLEWREVSGDGVLASWTVDRMDAPAASGAPRTQAWVDLNEGLRILSWLVECDPARLRVGLAVRVAWIALHDGLHWPAFSVAAGPGAPGRTER
ncbi:Zn-ribbon domain-containing OB-fold protein [Cupriavidus oxalaticus]|uniref:ChsH2 C-terminal OB-fold domain-containing protein n=3 Tax=Burkholderiales TaxID=80840 RepID=A0A4P7LK27_9BURK|nr:OB-fold domain-containing protein [Cupriavidus oxalaticus]AFK33043.1 hypothetical protein Reut_D6482 [Variovorax sp. DB1]QBY56520.1 hypothetical protein E0W60_36535 [Cupriavidus oxalaticus]